MTSRMQVSSSRGARLSTGTRSFQKPTEQTRRHSRRIASHRASSSELEPEPEQDHRPSSSHSSGDMIHVAERNNLYDGLNDVRKTRNAVQLPISNELFQQAEEEVQSATRDFADVFTRFGYTALVDAIFDESYRANHPFFNDHNKAGLQKLADWRSKGVAILCDTPAIILKAVLGQIAITENRRTQDGKRLARYFDQSNYDRYQQVRAATKRAPAIDRWVLRHKEPFAPSFYVRVIADAQGNSPTPAQLRQIINFMKSYISGNPGYDPECVAIDNVSGIARSTNKDIRDGLHAHLDDQARRAQIVATFYLALEKLLDKEAPKAANSEMYPFKYNFKYFGFTINEQDRTKKHNAGTTNWLKALFYDICRMKFKDDEGNPMFSWHQFIIGFPVDQAECRLGEELFCRMVHGYFYTGLGFNIQPAGQSSGTSLLDDHDYRFAVEKWAEVRRWREEGPDFAPQLEQELQQDLPRYKAHVLEQQTTKRQRHQKMIEKRASLLQNIQDKEESAIPQTDIWELITQLESGFAQVRDAVDDEDRPVADELGRLHKTSLGFLSGWTNKLFRDE